jgi:hypothetical protein
MRALPTYPQLPGVLVVRLGSATERLFRDHFGLLVNAVSTFHRFWLLPPE